MQRIEQGMGRGVRDSDDHCAVLLVGSKLAMATRDPDWKKLFSPATRAQLDLSNQVAVQLKGQGLDAVRSALTACLDRDPNWVERSRRALAEIRYLDAGTIRPEAIAIRAAFDLASAGQYSAAADEIQRAINGIEDTLLRTEGQLPAPRHPPSSPSSSKASPSRRTERCSSRWSE
ncbi:hypothetical protein RAM_29720 [Amycolatopsis mediterranei S699]|uniref:Uncharacterized protein n=1 Tax=Amycolatopsis mediterranei (strain S699) TaxID=713604 RepID=A0A9R0P1E0_AMYMS|nr:hypothetical protein RAM_29720 [Amycolatopsis mediterranei S699]